MEEFVRFWDKVDWEQKKRKTNRFRCRVCGRYAIQEELDLHECRALKDYKIDKERFILWAYDGHQWYPLKLREAYPTEHDREEYKHRLDRT